VALILLAAGALFGALFLLNNLLRTLFRSHTIRFFEVLLAFLATLVPLAALVANSTLENPDGLITQGAAWLALAIAGISLFVLLLELFRPQRLKASRGLLGVSSGLLVLVSSFTVPFAAAYFVLSTTTNDAPAPTQPPEITEIAEATDQLVERSERFNTLFRAVRLVVSEEIDIGEVTLFTQLDEGKPLAEIVEEHGGDVEHVIARIAEIMRLGIQEAADLGEMNPVEAALLLSQMETLVRIAVSSNLVEFTGRFGEPTPTGTRPSLLSLLTEPAPTDELTPGGQTVTPAGGTPERVESSTPTRTPSPTLPPTATRFHFSTRTPTPSPTPVTPCLASVEYNLRLRALPSEESETLLVIPYTSTIELVGHSADASWWATSFDGQSGWVDGAYLMLSAACDALPVIEPDTSAVSP
jgi:hypothetical protein